MYCENSEHIRNTAIRKPAGEIIGTDSPVKMAQG